MSLSVRSRLLAMLPPSVQLAMKRRYYPWLISRFDPSRWQPAAIVRRLVNAGDLVVDAGANIGYVTALLSRWVGPVGSVEAVEPLPVTFSLLSHNVRVLKLGNVRCHAVGLAEHNSESWMDIPLFPDGRQNLYEARIVGRPEAGMASVPVQLRRLDTLLADRRQPVSFLKIDVEGYELQAIRGGWDVLTRDRPALLIEVSGDPDARGSAACELVDALEVLGYKPWLQQGDRVRARQTGDVAVDYFFLTPHQVAHFGLAA